MILFIDNDSGVTVYNSKYLEKVESLCEYLSKKFKTSRDNFWLSYGGKVLLDNFLLDDYLKPNSIIYLNWKPLNVVKIISGSNVFFIDYHMIYNFKKFNFRRFVKNKDEIIEVKIPKNYLNSLIFDNWFEIYKYSRSIYNLNFNKSSDKKYIKAIVKDKFFNILDKKKLSELSDLSILFDHINNKFYFNLINCFISMKFLINKKPEYLANLILFQKN